MYSAASARNFPASGSKITHILSNKLGFQPFIFIYDSLKPLRQRITGFRVHFPLHQVGTRCSIHRKPFIFYPLDRRANELYNP